MATFFLLGAALVLTSVQQITGGIVVSASTAEPVAGATIHIPGHPGSARTSSDGRFTWRNLPTPPFVAVVILPDGRVARPVTVVDRSEAGLQLRIDTTWSESLTIRGAAPDIATSPAAALSTDTSDALALRHPATLTQAVEHVPGLSWISQGQDAAPSIRGLARGRTMILLDGGRVLTERGAGANASFLDPAWLARIDVARGPGSVAYGTDAFGGVVAARTRAAAIGTPLEVRFTGSLGTGMPKRQANLELGHGYASGSVLAAIRAREFDDYSSPDGVVPLSAWQDRGARLAWIQMVGGHRLTVNVQTDEARSVGHPRNDSAAIEATSPFDRSHRVTAAYGRPAHGGWRDVHVDFVAASARDRLEQDRLAAPGRPRRVDRVDSSAKDVQVRLSARRVIGPVGLRTGADMQRRYGVSATDTAFQYNNAGALMQTTMTQSLVSAQRTSTGAFVEGDMPVPGGLRLGGGVRGEDIRVTNAGGFFGDQSRHLGAVAANAALTWTRESWLVTAQVARGFRDPTLTDRFSRGPVGRGFLEGNPALEPETSVQFDMTARYARGRIAVDAAAYRYALANLVERYTDGPDLFRLRNRARARLAGLEVAARVEAGRGLAFDIIAQTSRGRDADVDTPLNDIAAASLSVIARHGWHDRVQSYVRVAAVRAHDDFGPAEVRTPGYVLADTSAGFRLSPRLAFRAIVRNVLNQRYFASAGPRWVLAPGRQFVVAMEIGR